MARASWKVLTVSILVFACFSGCGVNPTHLDKQLAIELVAKPLAHRRVAVRIDALNPMTGDTARRPAFFNAILDSDRCASLYASGLFARGSDEGAGAALVRAGYLLKRYRFTQGCPSEIYVFTSSGRALSKTWERKRRGVYSVTIGTGYSVGDIRHIRFYASRGTYYASFAYKATPILNDLGQLLVRDGDTDAGSANHFLAQTLLLNDGWALSSTGAK